MQVSIHKNIKIKYFVIKIYFNNIETYIDTIYDFI